MAQPPSRFSTLWISALGVLCGAGTDGVDGAGHVTLVPALRLSAKLRRCSLRHCRLRRCSLSGCRLRLRGFGERDGIGDIADHVAPRRAADGDGRKNALQDLGLFLLLVVESHDQFLNFFLHRANVLVFARGVISAAGLLPSESRPITPQTIGHFG
ncbi:MAG: pentapeptide repeat-containing protein [Hyphomicrobium sp.]|nr:pentapeptide repeat-containing protein [Hyphomicrobium sp.]